MEQFSQSVYDYLGSALAEECAGRDKLSVNKGLPSIQMEPTGDNKSVHAAFRVVIPANKWQEALVILNSVIELIRFEEGCISCRLYQDLQEEGSLMLEQRWSKQSDLERHLRTDLFRTVLLVVEMAAETPEIGFDIIERTTGLEAIERIKK